MKALLLSALASVLTVFSVQAEKETILIVLTNHAELGDTGKPTGFFLSEASHPWEVFRNADYKVELASPNGGPAPVDPKSYKLSDPANAAFWKEYGGDAEGKAIPSTRSLKEIKPEDYVAVFFAGGHGTMWDFAVSPEVTRVVEQVYGKGGVVAAVCHGPVALVNAKKPDAPEEPLVKGRKIAVFTNQEEAAVELTKVVPFLPEDRFKELGAEVVVAPNFEENAVRDGRIVTGQNPASATRTAELVLEALIERNDSPED